MGQCQLMLEDNEKNNFCAAVIAIGILSGRLACGNGNGKTLVLQWTNKKFKARKNKLIVAIKNFIPVKFQDMGAVLISFILNIKKDFDYLSFTSQWHNNSERL
jgi:hypothetical protein